MDPMEITSTIDLGFPGNTGGIISAPVVSSGSVWIARFDSAAGANEVVEISEESGEIVSRYPIEFTAIDMEATEDALWMIGGVDSGGDDSNPLQIVRFDKRSHEASVVADLYADGDPVQQVSGFLLADDGSMWVADFTEPRLLRIGTDGPSTSAPGDD